ncbi:MAG: hypothetical protein ACC661_02390 [Verrucomicrobiales bacterium]
MHDGPISMAGGGWKVLGGAITLFWLVVNGYLVNGLIHPQGGGLSEVPPEFVAALFLGRAEPSQLIVVRGERMVGELSVGSRRGGGPDPAFPTADEVALRLSIAGWLALNHPALEARRVTGRMTLGLGEDYALQALAVKLRIPGVPRGFELSYDPGRSDLRYRFTGDADGDGADGGAAMPVELPQLEMMLAMWGVDIRGLLPPSREEKPEGKMARGEAERFRARHGLLGFRGERFHGYVLESVLPGGQTLEMVFSDAGELMRVRGLLDYELLAEIFVPEADRETALE